MIKEETYEWNSDKGRELINIYGIKKVPTFLLSEEAVEYENIKDSWDGTGIVKDGVYVATQVPTPYLSVSDGKVKGLVTLIRLFDSSCEECYDLEPIVNVIAQNLGVYIQTDTNIDSNSAEGKSLISEYTISKVPTILLSPEINDYPSFINAWEQVGSKESNGWNVLRNPESIDPAFVSKDLSTGELVGLEGP